MNQNQKDRIEEFIEAEIEELISTSGITISKPFKLKDRPIVLNISVSNDFDEEGYEDDLWEEIEVI